MRKSLLSLIALFTVAVTPINVFAATYSTEVTNSISVGDINIGLEESEDTVGTVLPGQKIKKTIKIKNKANKTWVRAKFEYSDCGEYKGLSDEDVELASNKWKKIGDYFYRLDPIEDGETIDFVKSFNVPSDWDSERAEEQFSIYTSVDAVQFSSFTPNFRSSDPWFGTVIEECVHSAQMIPPKDHEGFSVVLDRNVRELVRFGDNFFSNWGSLMPGDTLYGKVTIGNNYARPVYMYFRTESTMDDDFADRLQLTIMNGRQVIYNGPLSGSINEDIKLGVFQKGNRKDLTYKITVPADLTNEYAFRNASTKWIFTASYKDTGFEHHGGGNGGGNGGHPRGEMPQTLGESRPTLQETDPIGEIIPEESMSQGEQIPGAESGDDSNVIGGLRQLAPQTGDTSHMMFYFWSMVFFGVSAAGMIFYNWRRSRRDNNEKR